jgi:hypothetical protein
MAIADDIKKLQEFVDSGGQRFVYEGVTYNLEDAKTLLGELKEKQKPEVTAGKEKTAKIEEAQQAVKRLQDELELKLNVFSKPEEYVTKVSVEEIRKAQSNLQFANESLTRLTSQTDKALISRNLVLNTRAEDARLKAANAEAKKSGQQIVEPTKTETLPTASTGGGTDGAKVLKRAVDAKLVELNLPDTPENRKVARQAVKTDKTAALGAEDKSWEPLFKENYPQYSWMFTDLDRTKYADVFTLFSKAIDPKTGKQIMTDEEFDRRYIGTSFYRGLESSKKGRELSAAIGNFSWGSGNLAKFLTKATQFGYEGDNLKQQAYAELFSKTNGKYVNDLAVNEVRASTPYLSLKDIGKQYFFDFADSQVEQVLAGTPNADGVAVSRDDLIRKARLAAKAMYGHLSEQIDAGLTLEDLSASYKEKAAKLLELDPNTINFATDFSDALNYRKDGQPRVLSMSEWETELRTNDKYKYSFTKQANQDATSIGLAIARAFGKVQ